MLNIKNLKKRYHTEKNEIEALEDISFDLKSNEIISDNFTSKIPLLILESMFSSVASVRYSAPKEDAVTASPFAITLSYTR